MDTGAASTTSCNLVAAATALALKAASVAIVRYRAHSRCASRWRSSTIASRGFTLGLNLRKLLLLIKRCSSQPAAAIRLIRQIFRAMAATRALYDDVIMTYFGHIFVAGCQGQNSLIVARRRAGARCLGSNNRRRFAEHTTAADLRTLNFQVGKRARRRHANVTCSSSRP